MLLTLSLALAHVPHDLVGAVATPPGLDDAQPWILLSTPHDEVLFARSDDLGLTWTLFGGAPQRDRLADVAWVGATLVALGAEQVWWSEDVGATWSSAPLPGDVLMAEGGDALVLAGPGGVWRGPPAGPWEQELPANVQWLGDDVLVDAADGIWRWDGTWEQRGTVPGAQRVAAGDAGLWAGDAFGQVWRNDGAGGWAACGAIPGLGAFAHPTIVAMAASTERLLVAPANRAPYTSTDGCASWADTSVGEEPAFPDPNGGPKNDAEAWTAMRIVGDRVLVAGWGGVFRSEDAGAHWTDAPVLPPALVRGMDFSPAFTEDGVFFLGSYAAAIVRYRALGATVDDRSVGLSEANVQTVQFRSSIDVLAVVNHDAYRSQDGGGSWSAFGPELPQLANPWFTDDGRFWILGPGIAQVSEDGGQGFTDLPGLVEVLGGAAAAHPVALGGRTCVASSNPAAVWCTSDLEVWSRVWASADADLAGLVAVEDTLWVASSGEVAWEVDGAWTSAPIDDRLRVIAAADDGTIYLGSSSGRLWSSLGGDAWADLGVQVPGPIYSLAPLPDHAARPGVLIGNHDGLFLASGAVFGRFVGDEWIDDESDFLVCFDCLDPVPATGAIRGLVRPFATGSHARAWVRGTRVALFGTGDPAAIEVEIDGVVVEGALTASASRDRLWEVDGLADGWHLLVVTAVAEGFALDAVRTEMPGWLLPEGEGSSGDSEDRDTAGPGHTRPPLPPLEGRYAGGCFDGGGFDGGAAALGLLGLAGARRRRRGKPTF